MLDESALRKGSAFSASNDYVVENSYINGTQCGLETLRNCNICLTWLRDPTGVVMGKYDCCCIVLQRCLHYFPWVHCRAVYGASEQFLHTNYFVLVVQEYSPEDFMLQCADSHLEELSHRVRVGERYPISDAGIEDVSCSA